MATKARCDGLSVEYEETFTNMAAEETNDVRPGVSKEEDGINGEFNIIVLLIQLLSCFVTAMVILLYFMFRGSQTWFSYHLFE